MKKALSFVLIATTMMSSLTLVPHAATATEASKPLQSCEVFANTMTAKVVDIFHDTKQTEPQKRDTLAALFQQAVDTDWIGQFVLGRFWKTASPADQAEYLKYYRSYLTMAYISKFSDESGHSVDTIKIAGLKPLTQQNQFEAATLIQRKGQPDVKVDYALEQSADKCRVHDIKVENISLLTSQRSEFSTLAQKSGVKGVIAALKKQLGQ